MVHEGVALVAFGPDGRLLAPGGLGTDARVWDASTGEGVSRLPHGGAITAMVFGSDGARLMTGSIDGAARVWDPLTGREVARLQPRSAVLGVAVAPDGRHVATASEDGYVRTWFLRPDDLVAEACARVTRNLTREEWSQFLGEEPYVATCPNLPSEGNGRAAASPP